MTDKVEVRHTQGIPVAREMWGLAMMGEVLKAGQFLETAKVLAPGGAAKCVRTWLSKNPDIKEAVEKRFSEYEGG